MRRLVEHRISLGEGEKIQELGYKAAAGGNKNIHLIYTLKTTVVINQAPKRLKTNIEECKSIGFMKLM